MVSHQLFFANLCFDLREIILIVEKEMGLGKTLTTLTLIMNSADYLQNRHKGQFQYGGSKTTLIVTPLSRKLSNGCDIEHAERKL